MVVEEGTSDGVWWEDRCLGKEWCMRDYSGRGRVKKCVIGGKKRIMMECECNGKKDM